MLTFKNYCKQKLQLVIENKLAQEVVHKEMVGIHELMTDDVFLNWFEKLSDKILNTMTMFEIYKKYQKEVLKK